MRITEVEIRNFRSLRHVKLDDLGTFVILIGRNGSGKSNILEALEIFFADLNLTTDVEKQATPELWFDKRNHVPIDIRVAIQLEAGDDWDDLDYIFSKEVLASLKLEAPPQEGRKLIVRRQIVGKLWKNIEVALEGVFYTKDGKVTFKRAVSKPSSETPSEGTAGASMVVSAEGELDAEASQALLNNLTAQLKNEFKLIRGPRESTERPSAPARPAILDADSKNFFKTLALETDRSKEEQWNVYVDQFRAFSGRRMQVRGTNIEFLERDLALPLELSGSGDQALLILMRQFHQEKWFYGIEEPETRLHHDYIRRLFGYLRDVSREKQIFVATHSPVFVDKAFLKNTWLTRIEDKETRATRVDKGDLRDILLELGIRPSDFFFSDRVLFVEGPSDKEFIRRVAEKAGIEFANVKVLPVRGKERGKYNLRVWLEAAQDAGIGFYFLLDKNAKAEADDLINARRIDRDDCKVLDKPSLRDQANCDIEDFYPKELLKEALKHFYGDRFGDSKKGVLDGEPVAAKITAALGTDGWKRRVAMYVGDKLTPEHLEGELLEIVRFLRRIPY